MKNHTICKNPVHGHIAGNMKIELLYDDAKFNRYLRRNAMLNRISEFDSYVQATMLEIVECGYSEFNDCRRAAGRVAKRMSPDRKDFDVAFFAVHRNRKDEEQLEHVMGRLIFEGKAKKVG